MDSKSRETDGAHAEDGGTHRSRSKGEAHKHSKVPEVEARVTEGFEDFVDAAKKGARDAAKAAENTIPAVKQGIAKGTYVCCYYVAFAAVYSACLAMELLPEDSPIRLGFRDGTEAAHTAHSARAKHAEDSHDQPEQAQPLPA
jgi:hypothetical protein